MRARPLVYLLLFVATIMVSCDKKGLKAADESNPVDRIETLSNEISAGSDEWTKENWDDAADLLENALRNLPNPMTSDEETIVQASLAHMKVYGERHRRKASGILEAIEKFSPKEETAPVAVEEKPAAQPAAPQPAPQPVAVQPVVVQQVAAPPAGLLLGSVIREGGYTNVRSGAGTNYGIVTKIKDGSPIYYTNYNSKWCIVYDNAGNMLGYMHSSKVIPSGGVTTAPRATATSPRRVADGTIFDWLAQRYVNENDIANHRHELRILRNAIYARHYRRFKDAGLRNYFNSFQWYDGYRDEIPASELNKYEKYNIQFIQRYE